MCEKYYTLSKNPRLATKLPIWGARVQASIPPIVDAPIFAFRKPYPLVFPLSDYVEKDMLSASQAYFLAESIKAKKNVLIGGGTGSGKTSFINSLLKIVSETNNRLYIVEDTPELRCEASNKVKVRTNPYYSCHDAVMDALRYRPDRIIVGEIRDGTALDLLKSWNTGHGGGLASVHANDCRSMLDRMCQLIEEVVPKAPRYLVAEAVNICVYITKDSNHLHGRRVSEIAFISGYNAVTNDWHLEYIE